METTSNGRVPVPVTIRTMLEAGAHFGHQTHRWNPRMLPYIHGVKNGIHIINLDATQKLWDRARKFILDTAARGGSVLFVGTKEQARAVVEEEARRSNSLFVTRRWLGGTLSNFETIKRSFEKMRKLEDLLKKSEDESTGVKLIKKEKLDIRRQLDKFDASLGGLRDMRRVPDVMFVIDIAKETIAVAEARRVGIPVIGLVDTNVNPDGIDFPIPANDDASRTIRLFVASAADAVLEGASVFQSRMAKSEPQNRDARNKNEAAAKNVETPEVAQGSAAGR